MPATDPSSTAARRAARDFATGHAPLASTVADASGEQPQAATQAERILIAEDDDLIAFALKSLLESKGRFSCVRARDFAELSQALEQGTSFTSIILDLHMPGMVGFDSVKAIKQKVPGCPILVFTGDNQASVIELFSAGVSGVVFKTSGLGVIKTALAKVISGRRFIPDNSRTGSKVQSRTRYTQTRIDVRGVRRRLLLRGLFDQ